MDTILYGREKLNRAVITLTGSGPIRDRLINAWIHHLSHIRPEENLPEELREEFTELEENSSCIEESYSNTINKMSEIEINDSIEKIVSLYGKIAIYK